ncbi:hypothetical protein C9I92_15185 [Photobacterium ganghwense]|uniref:Uncharacterized protein n=1 Tax=Photobacterium ganghwense TaxID=320778 RepID=A0A0J1H8I2_9GAMM|nr:hypothetical protein [Photobacterium ganghwense]KLV07989.1 hypothetical protein ABT57_14170 [Photobacterium ganghwense]PSU07096.1 hypothetical protein C9I92_15185 [Photobacterium ganghwense]
MNQGTVTCQASTQSLECFIEQENQHRECLDVIQEIMGLAISHHQIIKILVEFLPYTAQFSVRAFDINWQSQVVSGNDYEAKFYLNRNRIKDNATPLQQLLDIEDDLIELVAEAKAQPAKPVLNIQSLDDLATFAETHPFSGTQMLNFYEIRHVNTQNIPEVELLAEALENETYGMVGLATPELIRGFVAGGEA